MSKKALFRNPKVTSPVTVLDSLRALGVASKRSRDRIIIEDWAIQFGLDRLGERRLSLQEQKLVMLAVRDPKTFPWPEWWGKEVSG